MLSCFSRGRRASFAPDPTSASSAAVHSCSPSSQGRGYFKETKKDPCSLVEEVKTHLKMVSFADTMSMPAHITEDVSFLNAPTTEVFYAKEDCKRKNIRRFSLEDYLMEDKELDGSEAEGNTYTETMLHRLADGNEPFKRDISEEITLTHAEITVTHAACVADNHQEPESDYDEINMSGETSSSEDVRDLKQGALNIVAHADYKEYHNKDAITSQSKIKPGALYSYGISDQQRDFLFLCAGLVIQAVGFQLRSLVEVATTLILLCYRTYICVCRFAETLSQVRQKLVETPKMLSNVAYIDRTRIALHRERWESMGPLLIQGAKKMGWGCLSAAYVVAMLSALLLTSCLFSYLAVKGGAIQKPIHITQEVYFDYTKAHPVASVDLLSLDAYSRMSNATKSIKGNPAAGVRYRCTALLTLPESDHNRQLGVFQVRSELLSEKGEIMVKSSQPCMLLFKSNIVYYVKSMVMAAPLLAGLASETQTLRLNLLEWQQGESSARMLRIVLEPRSGLAISISLPQLYEAQFHLHSLHGPSNLPSSSSYIMLRSLFIWIILSFLIFGCLSSLCMYMMHHTS